MIGSCMVLDKQHVIMVNTCGIVGMRGVGRCIYQGILCVRSQRASCKGLRSVEQLRGIQEVVFNRELSS